jgi:hypothetical protein
VASGTLVLLYQQHQLEALLDAELAVEVPDVVANRVLRQASTLFDSPRRISPNVSPLSGARSRGHPDSTVDR